MVGEIVLYQAPDGTVALDVRLLEKTGATKRFLVFGNERRVPVEWLARYGKLRDNVDFYFLTENGNLERLG